MKKIFTLIAMAAMALSANAQQKYGIYADTSDPANLGYADVLREDGSYGYGINSDGVVKVTPTNGSATHVIADLETKFNPGFYLQTFNNCAFIYDYIPSAGNSNWGVSYGGSLLVCTGYTTNDDTKIEVDGLVGTFSPNDVEVWSRWPKFTGKQYTKSDGTIDNEEISYNAKNMNLYQMNPDYWTGMTVEVPAGQTLTVNKISASIGAGNNMWWSINILDEAGNMVYDSNVAQIQAGNSTTKGFESHAGYSADITSTEVVEPMGGNYFHDGKYTVTPSSGPPIPKTFDLHELAGGNALPITKAKIDAWTNAIGWAIVGDKTPASLFQTLPEGGLKLTGKNTVRIYFGCTNSRLLGIGHLNLEGSLGAGGSTGIDNVVVENDANAPVYNVAGQIVGENYKGIVIKNGKKVVIK